jgi:hypothetical protein
VRVRFFDRLWRVLGWSSIVGLSISIAVLSGWFDEWTTKYWLADFAVTIALIASGAPILVRCLALTRDDPQLPSSSSDPPGLAEWLVTLIVPSRRADAVLGDLEERFHKNVASRGLPRARMLYWAETLRSIGPILWMKAKQVGFLALVAEIWRRSRM